MVKIKKIFDGKKKEDDLFKSVKELSEKIGEYPSTSIFMTIKDAITTGSEISLIEKKSKKETEIQRDFILA